MTLENLNNILNDLNSIDKIADTNFATLIIKDRFDKSLLNYYNKVKDVCDFLSYSNPVSTIKLLRKEREDEQGARELNDKQVK